MLSQQRHTGFTLIELLIVIVVIAILAAISVVAYSGVQNRANDTAVKSDLSNVAKQFEMYRVDHGVYPVGDEQLSTLNLRLSKSAYGNGMADGEYNFLYCRVADDGPIEYAFIASSKSGAVFTYRSSTKSITTATSWGTTNSSPACKAAGINQIIVNDRDILYQHRAWQPYVQ